MTKEVHIPFTRIRIGRFLFLLISILLVILVRPFLEDFVGIKFLMDLFFSLILISGVYAVSRKKNTFLISLIFAFPAFFMQWSSYIVTFPGSLFIGKLFGILFYLFLIAVMIDYLFKEEEITADMIIGAICVYMLIGAMWSSIFTMLEIAHPGSFRIPDSAVSERSHFFYYSFVTLTTLGYGDITPVTSAARSFSIVEAIIGQLYIAILVSRLVGVHIAQTHNN
ncbi:MAG: two pore domain potassium channel family protein [Desulfobacteraceae bacterium]|nr:MAG: two pore domain potassium channel family protein [Desulfobacteraceae bacterium]